MLQPCFASDFIWFQTSNKAWQKSERPFFLEGRISETILNSLDSIYKKIPLTYTFYEKEGKLFVQVGCTFDLYDIQEDKLLNLYQSYGKGFNCTSYAFGYAGSHYLFGGYGFWRNHLDLLYFDQLHGSWELMPIKNQPEDLHTSYIYQNSEGLVALFGVIQNPRSGVNEKTSNVNFLEWKTKKWKEMEFHIEGLDPKELVNTSALYFVQTQDYAFWAATSVLENISWNLIEKETGKIFYFPNKNIDMGISPYLEVVGNVLTYNSPSGDIKTLDLDEIRKKSKEVGYLRVKEASAFDMPSSWGYILFCVVLAVGWVVVKKTLPKKKTKDPEEQPIKIFEPIQLLLPYSGQLLTTDTLDQLLGIDDKANFDTRRMKRARLINEINTHYLSQKGKALIVREKKVEDKRYVFYKIQA
jgi:hypothetical protein